MVLALLLACAEPVRADLPVHTLAFGGDLMLGRQLNIALADPVTRAGVLGDVALLRSADLALVNAEGVIATGGYLVGKGEVSPINWRVGPEAVEMIADAGIDVVSFGNNHAGDYGPEAVREGVQRLRLAGLDAVGAGLDATDARTPVYRRVGDTVVAFVGVDLTGVRAYRAGDGRPGTFAVKGEDPEAQDEVVAELARIADEARAHAQVVLLTPHWGPNWRTEPLPVVRTLAHRLIDAGYDGVLGHSAHAFQGVEIVEGKPVIFDAGNLTITYASDDATHRAMLYELTFTRAGITGVTGWPLDVGRHHTEVATGAVRDRILREWGERTTALGTRFTASEASVHIPCDPGGIAGPRGAAEPPRRTATAVQPAPAEFTVAALPPEATPARVRWANGVELLGYHLLIPTVRQADAAQVVTLYLRSEVAQARDLMIELRATGGRKTDVEGHWPGDWAVAGDRLPVGEIFVDRSIFSYEVPAEGGVEFAVRLRGVEPVDSDLPLSSGFAVLGRAAYDPEAKLVRDFLPRPGL